MYKAFGEDVYSPPECGDEGGQLPRWKWGALSAQETTGERSRPPFSWSWWCPIHQVGGLAVLMAVARLLSVVGSSHWPPEQFSLEVNESCLVGLGI